MVSESKKRTRAAARSREMGESPPCAAPDCGTTGGAVHPDGSRPQRTDGTRFGVPGKLCKKCYGRAQRRAAREARPPVVSPCSLCGTTAGYTRPGGCRPLRYDGGPAGRPGGFLCHDCFSPYRRVLSAPASVRAPWVPTPDDVAREAAAILNSIAERGRAAEARRVAEAYAASRWVSPREASRRAVAEFRATAFGAMAFPPRAGERGVRAQ